MALIKLSERETRFLIKQLKVRREDIKGGGIMVSIRNILLDLELKRMLGILNYSLMKG